MMVTNTGERYRKWIVTPTLFRQSCEVLVGFGNVWFKGLWQHKTDRKRDTDDNEDILGCHRNLEEKK